MALVDRRGYLTVVVERKGEDNMLVRRPENVKQWFNLLQRMIKESRTRVMKATDKFWAKKKVMDTEKMEDWLEARARIGAWYQYTQDRPINRSTYSMDREVNKQKKRATSECESNICICCSSINVDIIFR